MPPRNGRPVYIPMLDSGKIFHGINLIVMTHSRLINEIWYLRQLLLLDVSDFQKSFPGRSCVWYVPLSLSKADPIDYILNIIYAVQNRSLSVLFYIQFHSMSLFHHTYRQQWHYLCIHNWKLQAFYPVLKGLGSLNQAVEEFSSNPWKDRFLLVPTIQLKDLYTALGTKEIVNDWNLSGIKIKLHQTNLDSIVFEI